MSTYPPKQNTDGKYICLNCDKIIPYTNRKKYCSDECSWAFLTKNNHGLLRTKLIKQNQNKCDGCGYIFADYLLVLDHIIPIALGGAEFDENNLQILCKSCNKIKTKKDMSDIAKLRNHEKLQNNGQRFLIEVIE